LVVVVVENETEDGDDDVVAVGVVVVLVRSVDDEAGRGKLNATELGKRTESPSS